MRRMDSLKSMGERFRSTREEMNLTLKEVENAISIRALYLQAIEEGRVHHFLSPVYSLGFIRQYANFLNLDPEKLAKEYPQALRLPGEKQDFAYGIGTLEARGHPHSKKSFTPILFWTAGIFILGVAAWYFGKLVGAF
jgi:cytoskeletal protein RodZ